MRHTIEIDINLGGQIESEVHGILGSGCEQECKWLDLLGNVEVHKSTKDKGKTEKVALVKKVHS